MARVLVHNVEGGVVVRGEFPSTSVLDCVMRGAPFPLVIADPPYGGIVSEEWDKIKSDVDHARWMVWWSKTVAERLVCDRAAMYVWGGYGKPRSRPFFRFIVMVEEETPWRMAIPITWKKKRAYGVQHCYLSTREECAYLVNGDPKKPRLFNVPLLDKERGYAGWNKKFPAKSKFLRRTAVWTDVAEIMRGKVSTAQKPERLAEIMIETHTRKGETVLDPFAGCGSTGRAARKIGRRFVLVERDKNEFDKCVARLEES